MSKAKPSITLLRQLLEYDPETGQMFWRPRPVKFFVDEPHQRMWNTRYSGKRAFTSVNSHGYFAGHIFDKTFTAHRVIWALVYGWWPQSIDHQNHNCLDNRIENLKAVSHAQNCKNVKRHKDNTSGVTGVVWSKQQKKWVSQIKVNYKYHYLGSFKNKEEAVAIRKAAEIKYGFHPNHGAAALLENRQ
jgi:hypothetical protein